MQRRQIVQLDEQGIDIDRMSEKRRRAQANGLQTRAQIAVFADPDQRHLMVALTFDPVQHAAQRLAAFAGPEPAAIANSR